MKINFVEVWRKSESSKAENPYLDKWKKWYQLETNHLFFSKDKTIKYENEPIRSLGSETCFTGKDTSDVTSARLKSAEEVENEKLRTSPTRTRMVTDKGSLWLFCLSLYLFILVLFVSSLFCFVSIHKTPAMEDEEWSDKMHFISGLCIKNGKKKNDFFKSIIWRNNIEFSPNWSKECLDLITSMIIF